MKRPGAIGAGREVASSLHPRERDALDEVLLREEEDGSITVSFMDPQAVLDLVDQPGIHELAGEVKVKLEKVRDALNS